MATLPKDVEVPLSHDTECPICRQALEVVSIVDVEETHSMKAGERGFRRPVVTVHFNTKIKGFRVKEHNCEYDDPNEED